MRILVNGNSREVAAADLLAVLEELGYCEAAFATALNGEFIPISSRSSARVSEGDRIEIVAPMQGG